jgi:hypothetical protein
VRTIEQFSREELLLLRELEISRGLDEDEQELVPTEGTANLRFNSQKFAVEAAKI